MIREEDIVRLLGTGLDSDLSSLSSDEDVTVNFPDRELENLLDDFENDFQGLADFLVEMDEADEQIEIEPKASQVNEQINENVVPLDLSFQPIQNTTSFTLGSYTSTKKWSRFIPILKKNIFWKNVPFTPPIFTIQSDLNQPVLTNILNPIDYFTKYFSNDDFKNMAKYTNIYAAQKNLKKFKNTSTHEMKTMIAIHMLFGVLKYPRVRMYWEKIFRVPLIADNMTRNRLFELRSCFHVVDNKAIPKENSDKFVKIRPLYNSFIKRCAQLPVEQNLSVDEQIVPFKGNLSIKQYIRGKPSPWGIKIFLLCGQSGLVYNLLLYQGSSTQIDENMQKNFGLGGAIVLKLVENLKPNKHFLFFDNYFSSYNLFCCLSKYKIFAAGTIRINRFNNPPFPKDKQLAKMGRGTSFEICSNHNIALVKWFDNKAVQLGSNFISSGTPIIVQRFDRKKKSLVFIE